MEFFDTHCHIHEITQDNNPDDLVQSKWFKAGITDAQQVIAEAKKVNVHNLTVVGCSLRDSKQAVELAARHDNCHASIGIHPHEAKDHKDVATKHDFTELASVKEVVAIGECGLDYFYEHSPKADQAELLEFQLDLAKKHDLPVIFHVREAFDDFWPILSNFRGLRGVLHSFTDSTANVDKAIKSGLYIGLNGIMTFTKDQNQLEMAKNVPLENLVIETDAPFLTPAPHRGKICTPKHVVETAKFLSQLRGESLERLAAATTHNAKELFRLS